jgi:hypothetical protein
MSAPTIEELIALGLPTADKKPRLKRCVGCSEFFKPSDRACPACGLDQVLAQLIERASPEMLAALSEELSK